MRLHRNHENSPPAKNRRLNAAGNYAAAQLLLTTKIDTKGFIIVKHMFYMHLLL